MPDRKLVVDGEIDPAEESAMAEAEADVAAGRLISQDTILKWLQSWGTADELPCPVSKRD